jgi:hypothetical protein
MYGLDGPEGLPEVMDTFARFTVGLAAESLFKTTDHDGSVLLAVSPHPTVVFRPTVLLKDGSAAPERLPAAWDGRITPEVVADFLQAPCELSPRAPSWGAHASRVGWTSETQLRLRFAVQSPRIDPFREVAAWDGARHLPLLLKFAGAWGDVLTPWEQVDGFLGRGETSPLWIERRRQRVTVPSGHWWHQIRASREKGNPDAYRAMQDDPLNVTVYLGWPAYLWDAAGGMTQCPMCGGLVTPGRRYCGTPECDRLRNAARQRDSRTARRVRRARRSASAA